MAELINPSKFVIEQLPDLIDSDEPHALQGAALGALYLYFQEQSLDSAYNLAAAATQMLALKSEARETAGEAVRKFEEEWKLPVEEIFRGVAYLALAKYIKTTGQYNDENEIRELIDRGKAAMGVPESLEYPDQ